jgi:hypothetical protein
MEDRRPGNLDHPKTMATKPFLIFQTITGCNLLETKRLRQLALSTQLTRPQKPAHG